MAKKYKQGIYIDGIYFDIPLISVKRNFEFLDKYAERNEAGKLLRELIGVFCNYTMSFGTIDDDDLYEALVDKLSEAVPFHDFVLPSTKKSFAFRGYISSLADEMEKIESDTVKFKALTCKYIAEEPFRRP